MTNKPNRGTAMKPNKIKITNANKSDLIEGKVYDVIEWNEEWKAPLIDTGYCKCTVLMASWEPVQDFKHGEPVWAWDYDERCKMKGIYVGPYPEPVECLVHVVKCGAKGISVFKQVEHRKPTITLKELAKRADINLDEYELIE